MGRVLGLRMGLQRIAYPGNRFAVNENIGGTGNHRCGRKSLMVHTEIASNTMALLMD